MRYSQASLILSTDRIVKLLKSTNPQDRLSASMPEMVSTDNLPSKEITQFFLPSSPDDAACIEFTVSPAGVLAGVRLSHAELLCSSDALKVCNCALIVCSRRLHSQLAPPTVFVCTENLWSKRAVHPSSVCRPLQRPGLHYMVRSFLSLWTTPVRLCLSSHTPLSIYLLLGLGFL